MKGENDTSSGSPTDLMRQWFDMAAQAAEVCQEWTANPLSSDAMKQTRSSLFDIWSDYWEHYLRSATFLDTEKKCMAGGVETRKQFHELLGRLHHEMQLATAQDIDQIVRTMRRMNEDRQEQQDEISKKLNELSQKFDALSKTLSALEDHEPQTERTGDDIPDPHRRRPMRKKRRAS